MTPEAEALLLDEVREKYPAQADSLESYFWAGWTFNGFGSSDSVDISRTNDMHDVGYIRTDGTFRYA